MDWDDGVSEGAVIAISSEEERPDEGGRSRTTHNITKAESTSLRKPAAELEQPKEMDTRRFPVLLRQPVPHRPRAQRGLTTGGRAWCRTE